MFGDPKAIAKSIVSKVDEPIESPTIVEGDENLEDAGLDAAADEMFAAFEKKDVKGFRSALRSFVEQMEFSKQDDSIDDGFH